MAAKKKQTTNSGLPTKKSNLDRYKAEIEKLQNPQQNQNEDDRFWKITRDKAGNGFSIIRFLPAPKADGEDGLPWIRYFDHGFQGPGGWYIEKSLTTLGKKDPVSEYNSELWATGIEANKNIARNQKRRLHYVSRILVVKDPANPENDGKEFLFVYGKKIFDKLTAVMNPNLDEDPEAIALDPFDPIDGANFKLKVKTVMKFPNYDESSFAAPSKLEVEPSDGWSLTELIDEKHFKPYDELKARLEKVLGGASKNKNATVVEENNDQEFKKVKETVSTTGPDDAEDEDDLKLFQKLVDED
jgi:hypothetical protein